MKLAVVGATGLVGSKILEVLAERNFPFTELIPVASEKSKGSKVTYKGKQYTVVTADEAIALKPQLAIFSAGGSTSLALAPRFAAVGCKVVDNSSAWRMDPTKKLVVPEVNADVLTPEDMIIANPNCSTIQMVVALYPLHLKFGIKRIVVSTYQSVTGSGIKAVRQLEAERAGNQPAEMAYAYPIDLNLIPQIDVFTDNGYTKEEMKMVNETKKIMKDDTIRVTATTVRVPVMGGHSESANIEFEKNTSVEEIKQVLSTAPGVVVQDDIAHLKYPMPKYAHEKDEVFVGRIRQDFTQDRTFNLWIVSDNLRKGAATNAVQIAEYLLKNNLLWSYHTVSVLGLLLPFQPSIMNQFYTFFFVTFFLFFQLLSPSSHRVYAQQATPNTPKTMTLDQCIDLATTQNPDIKNATLEVTRTTYSTNTYISKMFPAITGNVDYRFNTEIPVTLIPAQIVGGKEGEYAPARFGVPQTLNLGLNLEQIIYNHAAFVGFQSIKPLKERSRLELEEVKDAVIYNVSSTFYSIEIAELQNELLKSNLATLEQTLAKTKPLADQGLLAQNEIEKIAIQIERLKTQLIEVANNKLKMYNMLKVLMGMSVQENVSIVRQETAELSEFYLIPPPPVVTNIRQTRIRKIGLDLLYVEKAAAMSAYLPTAVLRANYTFTGNNTEFNPFQAAGDQWFRSNYISLGIRIPIIQGLEGMFVRKMKQNQIMQAENSFEYFKKDLDRRISDAFTDYQSRKEIELSRKQIFDSQSKILKDESTLYEIGLTNIMTLLRAQDDLSRERGEYIISLVNLKRSELDYRKLINEIAKK